MAEYIAFDSHKHYTLVERQDVKTAECVRCRIGHVRGAIRNYLGKLPQRGDAVAVEATGNWYWIVQEIEDAGFKPQLVNPRKAKLMMGTVNKTDKLDVRGLNRLQRAGVLPTVWVPPAELRDLRELTRIRMVMSRGNTRLKNRIGATLSKYGLQGSEASDPFGTKGRAELDGKVSQLPTETSHAVRLLLAQIGLVQKQIGEEEKRLKRLVKKTPEIQLLMTLPGVGLILASVIYLEIGDIRRFASAEHLASYSGTTPRVHSSGDKTTYGGLRADVNRYLKWAFAEAANVLAMQRNQNDGRHVTQLYLRLREHKGHSKAIGAVARHLSEAAFYVLSKKEAYRDPALRRDSSREV